MIVDTKNYNPMSINIFEKSEPFSRRVFMHIEGDGIDQMKTYRKGMVMLMREPEWKVIDEEKKKELTAELSNVNEWLAIKEMKIKR